MNNQLKIVAAAIIGGLSITTTRPVQGGMACLHATDCGGRWELKCPACDEDSPRNETGSVLAPVPALTGGILAPTADVGSVEIKKATAQYSNSVGFGDSFSVGASTSIGSTANASSTPDYDVNSIAIFAIGSSTIDQQIGTANAKVNSSKNTISDAMGELGSSGSMSGTIYGSFDKTFSADGNANDVTVKGIGSDSSIIAGPTFFQSDIADESDIADDGGGNTGGAGVASGSASGNVGSTATVNSNSSQFVSSFAQAF